MGDLKRPITGKSRASVLVSICDAFQDVVRQYPDRIALKSGERQCSYAELDLLTADYAARLMALGVQPGDLVGFEARRGVDAILAMLSILRAGAAYLPLPEYYSADRLKEIAAASDLKVVLGNVPAIETSDIWMGKIDTLPAADVTAKKLRCGPDDPAYVMFTSGSTGTPKGVVVPHRGVLRLVIEPNYVELGADERLLQLAPLAFDAATFEVWGALLNGATLVVPEAQDIGLRALGEMIREEEISLMWLTVGLFQAIAEERPGDLAPLRQVLTGGDVVQPATVRRVRDSCPETKVINGYGPTENTTFSAFHPITDENLDSGLPLPIGKAISATQLYVLDDDLNEVEAGTQGELCVAGDGLALGYLGQKDLTDEVFVTAPWDDRLRLYRTGDLVVRDADGLHHFRGRSDRQVKIRGYRIELDAVEKTLANHPKISGASVEAKPTQDGADKQLVAGYCATEKLNDGELRAYLESSLPSYSIPQKMVEIAEMPLTATGKLDRKAVMAVLDAAPDQTAKDTSKFPTGNRKSALAMADLIAGLFEELLGSPKIARNKNFFELGASSLQMARAHERLQARLGRDFPITDLFAHATVTTLAAHLGDVPVTISDDDITQEVAQGEDLIAIIGMAGRFPGAQNVDALWDGLINGRELISHFTPEELDMPAEPGDVAARGIVEDADLFDARHFGIPPKEAERLDPQHRILLETAQTALEDAGLDPDRFDGKIGVYAGMSQNSYLMANLLTAPGASRKYAAGYPLQDFSTLFGNDKDFIATRIAYKLNLRGPAVNVQCACSTSLVAVANGCQALMSGDADVALAGGVSITFPQKRAYTYTPDAMASSDGHCRTFDADASGTVFGDGAGLVVLRRLEDALRDGDEVVAVIRGFAINNDGSAKAGYAAPSVTAQADVIRAAHKAAKVAPRDIGYVEAHGTGTPLGDPIEFAALRDAFSGTDETGYCWLGTAKTNLGHLDIAAGVTGLIKTALTLKHAQIPPLLHYKSPNKAIDFDSSAFRPVTDATNWERGDAPRRAGISAFGVGGTNIHMVLEEAPMRAEIDAPEVTGPQIIPLSASSKPALKAAISGLGAWARGRSDADIADVAQNMRETRRQYETRAVLVARDMDDLARAAEIGATPYSANSGASDLVFLFPGQGSQHVNMGRALYEAEPVFRDALDACNAILMAAGDASLTETLYPQAEQAEEMTERLKDTALAQPAIFSISYALARQWQAWGVSADAMIGHSVGEFVAATLAGVMSLQDALSLVRLRGALMSDLPRGSMISVASAEGDVAKYLEMGLDIASVNGAKSTVLAGDDAAVDAVLAACEADGIAAKRLHTSHAFHSRMMDPAVIPFRDTVAKMQLNAPDQPILSTVTGTWMTADEATDPGYWAGHMRAPVRFFDAVQAVQGEGACSFVEVGPGRTLSVLAGQTGAAAIASQPHAQAEDTDAQRAMLEAFGNLWAMGRDVDWAGVTDVTPRARLRLPTYPFQRERFWVEPTEIVEGTVAEASQALDAPTSEPEVEELLTPLEAVQNLLSDLSGIPSEEIDADSSFMSLGFDSLLLTQATKEIADKLGLKVTLRELIDGLSTPGALAAQVTIKPVTKAAAGSTDGTTQEAPAKAERPNVPVIETGKPTSTEPLLTPAQQTSIDRLVRRFNAKTPKSKALTDEHRFVHADPRTASGFNRLWKEIVYQIVTVESKGSRLLDIDGNEYIDILNGFGPGFLGHGFDPVVEAMHKQMDAGFEVGPQSLAAMEAASLFAEVTGNDRASFVCTGSEAVYAAMRLARTCTGRDKIVFFARDYHGNFDEVLARGVGSDDSLRTLPTAPGVPRDSVKNVVVLPYGTDASLDYIRTHANELAAVMVEPVQSRRPEFRPHEFIREIRDITRASESLFIFDEVVTGFRFGPRGAQDYYGIDADLVTYGKVVGGGMPLGVVSGKSRYMDTFDGGAWQFGDDSFPNAPVTFFAGTFVRHPLVMASLKAMLTHFRDQPSHFWKAVNAKGDKLAGTLDRWFEANDMPFQMPNCGSLMYLRIDEEQQYGGLFGAHIRDRGVFYLEGFPSYMTAAHDDEDIDYVIEAVKDSALEMRSAGLLTGREPVDYKIKRGVGSPPLRLAMPGGKDKIAEMMAEPIGPVAIPTTEAQREISAALAVSPELAPAYNECVSIRLNGPINADALERATNSVIARHDALQSTISSDGMVMHVGGVGPITVVREDLTSLGVQETNDALEALIDEQVETVFDLENGPLIRATLAMTPHGCDLILCGHHIVFDGWSIGVVTDEIAEVYRAQLSGELVGLSQAESFIDYARKDADWLHSADLTEAEEFWRKALEGAPSHFDLPTDYPRNVVRDVAADRIDLPFPAELIARLKKTAMSSGGTLVNLMLTAFNVHLARLSGQRDVTIAVPSAGQSAHEMYGLVGHCVNVMPVRMQLDPELSFAKAIKQVQSLMLDTQDHQNLTYGSLVRLLDLPRDPSRLPLTPVMFNMDRGIDVSHIFGSTPAELISHPRRAENFELFLNLTDDGETVQSEWTYSSGLFDAKTIHAHMAGLTQLLERIADDPSRPIAQLLAMSESEAAELSAVKTGPSLTLPEAALHDLVTDFADRYPDAVAIEPSDGARVRLSYRGLDAGANKVANALIARGIGRGDLVGISLQRGPRMVATMLGIMKAGAGYLPLDPAFPKERLSYIISHSGARTVLVDDSTKDVFADEGANLVDVSAEEITKASSNDPEIMVGTEDTAYVIYTSGSTGKPKGVEISHRAILNLLMSMRVQPGITRDDKLLAVTTISFDIAGLELWLPLISGASLVIASPEQAADPRELVRLIDDRKITMMQATPSTWRMMIASGWSGSKSMRALVGGEALPAPLANDLVVRVGALWNMYGPTETTVWSTCAPVAMGQDVSIGRPIANTTVHILGETLEELPLGVTGELYLGGTGLAKGYVSRRDLTEERFIEHDEIGERLYRTGDLARWVNTADGWQLECLGRIDSQIKLRGYRIELGEIDAALSDITGVGAAAAVLREAGTDKAEIVGYVTPKAGVNLNAANIRAILAERLPSYMVPARVVPLEALPQTPNGKIDRPALATRSIVGRGVGKIRNTPSTATEIALRNIWTELLDTTEISRNDSFFELGGHSLLAVRLFSEIRARWGLDLPISTLFLNPSISALASCIDTGVASGLPEQDEMDPEREWDTTVVIHPGPGTDTPPLFIVGGVGGNVNNLYSLGKSLGSERPVIGLQMRGIMGHKQHEDLYATAADHIAHIRKHQPHGPYDLAGYSGGAFTAFEMAQQLQAEGEEISFLGILDMHAPGFELEEKIGVGTRLAWEARTISKSGISSFWERTKIFFRKRTGGDNLLGNNISLGGEESRQTDRLARDWWGMVHNYEPKPFVGDAQLFIGLADGITDEMMKRQDPHLGWDPLIIGALTIVPIDAGHLEFLEGAALEQLTAALNKQLKDS